MEVRVARTGLPWLVSTGGGVVEKFEEAACDACVWNLASLVVHGPQP
jgi:hypothetical protein